MLNKVNEVIITQQIVVARLDDLSINPTSSNVDNFFESDKCPEFPIPTKEKFDELIEKLTSKRFLAKAVRVF